MFIISAILRLASIGSSSDMPYWFIAVVRTVAAAVASPPIVLLKRAICTPISCIAAGYFANWGESCDSSSLYDSTACAAEPPNIRAVSRALRSMIFKPSPATPEIADRSASEAFNAAPGRIMLCTL